MICSITRAQFLPYRCTRLCLSNKNDYILSRCHCLPQLVNRQSTYSNHHLNQKLIKYENSTTYHSSLPCPKAKVWRCLLCLLFWHGKIKLQPKDKIDLESVFWGFALFVQCFGMESLIQVIWNLINTYLSPPWWWEHSWQLNFHGQSHGNEV